MGSKAWEWALEVTYSLLGSSIPERLTCVA